MIKRELNMSRGTGRSITTKIRLVDIYRDLITLFKKECEELVQTFKSQGSELFQDFIPLWKAQKFNLIYEKYSKDGVLHLLKEDSLLVAKNIMFHDHFLGGLFLLYGFYFIQEDPRAQIRIDHAEFQKLLQCIKVERNNTIETCQPGFMFAKLLENNAFSFVRFSQEFSMESHFRSRIVHWHRKHSHDIPQFIDPHDWLRSFMQETDILDQLKEVDEEYFERKQQLKNDHPELNLALDLVPDDLVGGLKEALCAEDDSIQSSMDIDMPHYETEIEYKPFPDPIQEGSLRQKLKVKQTKKITRYWNKRAVKIKSDEETSTERKINKVKRGRPRGKKKFYFKSAVNDPETELSEEDVGCSNGILAMPDI